MSRTDVRTGRCPLFGPAARGVAILGLVLRRGRHRCQRPCRSSRPRSPSCPQLSTALTAPPTPTTAAISCSSSSSTKAKVQSFPNEANTRDKQLFLELPDPINRGNEEGLLGLAFHPKYKENGEFFVYYSWQSGERPPLGRLAVQGLEVRPRARPILSSEERIWVPLQTRSKTTMAAASSSAPTATWISPRRLGRSRGRLPLTTGQNPPIRPGRSGSTSTTPRGQALRHPQGTTRGSATRRPSPTGCLVEVYCIGSEKCLEAHSSIARAGTLWAGDVRRSRTRSSTSSPTAATTAGASARGSTRSTRGRR